MKAMIIDDHEDIATVRASLRYRLRHLEALLATPRLHRPEQAERRERFIAAAMRLRRLLAE